MSLPAYPAYKDSGIAWLGQIPDHWETQACRAVFTERSERNDPLVCEEYLSLMANVGVIPYAEKGDVGNKKPEDLTKCKLVFAGDLVINSMNYGIGSYGLSGLTGVCSPVYIVLKPKLERIEERFAFRILENKAFQGFAQSHGNGILEHRAAINWDILKGIGVPLPPVLEQQAILDYLDRETAKIDALVEEQKRLIELLKDKRQAVISQAVTKGLDPSVKMKDSGVEWLGIVPAHWSICQSRRMFAVRSEPALPTDQMLTASQKYGVLYQSDFVELEGRRVVEVIMGVENLKHVEPDDFIISMRSFQGGIEWCKLRGSTSFHYVMLRPLKHVYPPFFAHLFKSVTYIQALRATTDLIRDGQELRYSNFVQVSLPIVPIDEQAEIARFLDREVAKIDALTTASTDVIELLLERRAALISAAVTGKIDVRGLAPLPEGAAA